MQEKVEEGINEKWCFLFCFESGVVHFRLPGEEHADNGELSNAAVNNLGLTVPLERVTGDGGEGLRGCSVAEANGVESNITCQRAIKGRGSTHKRKKGEKGLGGLRYR